MEVHDEGRKESITIKFDSWEARYLHSLFRRLLARSYKDLSNNQNILKKYVMSDVGMDQAVFQRIVEEFDAELVKFYRYDK